MKNIQMALACLFVWAYSLQAYAWVFSDNATITNIIEWEGDGDVVFQLSSGVRCYIPSNELKMYSLILSLHASGKTADIHCHDATVDIGGYLSHKVHRVLSH